MAIGGGHTHYGRYGSGRGANPMSILSPAVEPATGSVATGATRVKLTRIADADSVSDAKKLIQFSTQKREQRGSAQR